MNEKFDEQKLFEMSLRQMKKHDVAAIWLHWFNATVWLLELATGGALIISQNYAFAPSFFREIITGIFGTRALMLKFHISLGVLWILVLLVYGIFGFKNYLLHFIKNDLVLDKDDFSWLKNRFLLMLGKGVKLPPQGPYNAGQKLYAMLVAVATVGLMITGPIMAFHIGTPETVRWAIIIHFVLAGGVLSGLFIHIYMAAVFPEERPAFFSMFTGKVPEIYAYRFHYKWWKEMKEEEKKYKEQLKKIHSKENEPQTSSTGGNDE